MVKILISTLNLIFLITIFLIYQFLSQNSIYEIIFVSFLFQIIIIALHIFYIYGEKEFNIFDGFLIISAGFFLHNSVAATISIYTDIFFYDQIWSYEDMPKAFFLCYLTFFGIQIGYYLLKFKSRGILFSNLILSEQRMIIFFLLIILFIFSYMLEGFGNNNPTLSGGFQFTIFTLIFEIPYFLILLSPNKKPIHYFIIIVGIVITILVSLFYGIGSKAGIVNLLVAALLYRNFFIKKIQITRTTVYLIIAIVAMLYLNYLRSIGYLSGVTAEKINPFSSVENFEIFTNSGFGSLATPFEALLVTIKHFPDTTSFQWGERAFEDYLYPLLPRYFWSEKPIVYGVATMWNDELSHFSNYTGRIFEAISLPGHFYQDFGTVGSLLSGLLMGITTNIIYFTLAFQNNNKASIALYGIIIPNLLLASRAFTWTSAAIIVYFILPLLIIRLLLKKNKNGIK